MYQYRLKKTTDWVKELMAADESGTMIALPGAGARRTIQSVFEFLKKTEQLELLDARFINFSEKMKLKLENQLLSSLAGEKKYFLVRNLNLGSANDRLFIRFLSQMRDKKRSQMALIFILDIDPHLSKLPLKDLLILFKNLYYFPYALENSKDFQELIRQNQKRFEIKTSQKQNQQIAKLTGGCPLLLKETFKFLKRVKKLPKFDDLEPFVTHTLQSLPSEIVSILYQLPKPPKSRLLESLVKLNFLKENKGEFQLSSQILAEGLSKTTLFRSFKIDLQKKQILVDDENVGQGLTKREKEFLLTLKKTKRVNRSKAALIFFNEKYDYSDYALDQAISRLRKRLAKIGVDPRIIFTQKRKGYEWRG